MDAIPEVLARVADLMAGYPANWAFCGGWSVDAWLGTITREHCDVDLTVFHDEQHALFEFFGDGWSLNGHDRHTPDTTDEWDGHELEFPAHVHARRDGFELDIQLDRRDGTDWLFSRRAGLLLPIEHCVRPSPWGIPVLAPEALLFYKAIGFVRPHDDADFRALAPTLTQRERVWLRDAIVTLRPGHEWLPALRG